MLFIYAYACNNRESCQSVSKVVQQIAVSMENGEFDFDGTPEKRVRLLTDCLWQQTRAHTHALFLWTLLPHDAMLACVCLSIRPSQADGPSRVITQTLLHGSLRFSFANNQCLSYRGTGQISTTTAVVDPYVIHGVEVSALSAPRCRPPTALFS